MARFIFNPLLLLHVAQSNSFVCACPFERLVYIHSVYSVWKEYAMPLEKTATRQKANQHGTANHPGAAQENKTIKKNRNSIFSGRYQMHKRNQAGNDNIYCSICRSPPSIPYSFHSPYILLYCMIYIKAPVSFYIDRGSRLGKGRSLYSAEWRHSYQ